MSFLPGPTFSGFEAEKSARDSPPSSGPTPNSRISPPQRKQRSCVTCRSRKVRCDKQSPCSNCRRANIACILGAADRPPRWARRLDRWTNNAATSDSSAAQDVDPNVGKVMDRLRNLEILVKELSGQLEHAHAAPSSIAGASSAIDSPARPTQEHEAASQKGDPSVTHTSSVQKQFGRLVLQHAGDNRYVSSSFWSCIDDELHGLKMDTRGLARDDSSDSDDEALSEKSLLTQPLERTPLERHAFLFRHDIKTASITEPSFRELHPLPSQIPFLIDVFSENVNFILQIVHTPTATKMVRDLRLSDMKTLSPSNEALMFSIYYAAITSLDEDDVTTNFGFSKADLLSRYRIGLEHALAKADFLNAPNITLVQAFALFLCVVRQHDSPRYVWMMSGMVVRMAQYLGLQRDGANFPQLTPFEIEMRRRVWWALCALDLRTSEDQGTDLTIASGSFDTKIGLNINDADINPELREVPSERVGVTDMTLARINSQLVEIMRQMMVPGVSKEDQNRMSTEIYQRYQQGYFQYTSEAGNMTYWAGATVARLVMAKMTLIIYLPALFSSSNEHFSDELRDKLLVSAIEVAEHNHALHAEPALRHRRWIFQTYTHWHSIVYLMIEASQRPWSPIVERAWVALHSSWLIPPQTRMDKKLRIWIPLRKLMTRARRHRNAELNRLREDRQAAAKLEIDDQRFPLPTSSGPYPKESSIENFRERWRQLVIMPVGSKDGPQAPDIPHAGLSDLPISTNYTEQVAAKSQAPGRPGDSSISMTYSPVDLGLSGSNTGQSQEQPFLSDLGQTIQIDAPDDLPLGQMGGPTTDSFPALPIDWSAGQTVQSGGLPWLWAESDSSVSMVPGAEMDLSNDDMDFTGEVDWYNWVKSAKGMEMDAMSSGGVG